MNRLTASLALGVSLALSLAPAPAPGAPPPPKLPMVALAAQKLAAVPGAHCSNPRPSPDGRWVSYEVDEQKDVRRQMVYSLRTRQTKRLQPVLETSAVRRKLSGHADRSAGMVCHELSWLPTRPAGAVMSCNNGEGNYDLYLVEADENLSKPAWRITGNEANDFSPTVTGTAAAPRVLYVSGRTGEGDIYALDLPVGAGLDGAARRLTSSASSPELSPLWSPRGDAFLYVRQTARGEDDLYRLAAEGGDATPVTRMPGSELNAAWSPDGTSVAFYSNARDRKTFDLCVRAVFGGGEPYCVATGTVRPEQATAAFTPDSRGLLYVHHEDPLNPLQVVWLDSPREEGVPRPVMRLDTQTLQNREPAMVALDDGRWFITWTAQAALGDKEKRWNDIYGAFVAPAGLRPPPVVDPPPRNGKKATPGKR